MAGPLLAMMSQMGGMAFGSQLGQALGTLSREVLTSTDIGLPLGPKGVAALMPEAIEALAEGLEQPRSEIMTFLAAREAAHHRLFSHVPWLSTPAAQRRRGLRPRHEGRHERHRGLRAGLQSRRRSTDPTAMEQLLNQGIFEPKATPEQIAALERLETLLALIEGWVQTVVTDALGDRIPGTSALSETLRRRRATGGPAEQTFATLVGLELRPRKLREAAVLWERLTEAVGADARDAVWQHPDLLPGADDLDEPAGFIDRIVGGDTSGIDQAIADLEKDFEERRQRARRQPGLWITKTPHARVPWQSRRMSRHTLNPAMPVLVRPDGAVQVGWDPRRAMLVQPARRVVGRRAGRPAARHAVRDRRRPSLCALAREPGHRRRRRP